MIPLSVKYSGSTATINIKALKRNLDLLKRKSGGRGVIAVVKANAYGHGAVEISRFIERGVVQLAVATVDEGIQLRAGGITKPILVFGIPNSGNAESYVQYKLTASVSHLDHFDILAPGTDYQVNFDTGMRRTGVYPEQVNEVAAAIKSRESIACKGFYSHYATADDPGSDFVFTQHAEFKQICSTLPSGLPAHMSNSAAVLHYDLDHFDMIRIGIGLTGYAPGKVQAEELQAVLSWETHAAVVRPVKKGDPVSYGGTWKAPSDGYLATLPVGYGDGIPRSLSNRLCVNIGDSLFPISGNVTMDFCMVFLSDKKIQAGTKVQLIGKNSWQANDWAEKAGTITHEILCGLTPRIRRVYQS